MKYLHIKVLSLALLTSITIASAQSLSLENKIDVLPGDTLVLNLPEYQGEPQWQESDNMTTWSDISDAKLESYTLIPTNSKYYRAKVTAGSCPVYYSDTIQVNVLEVTNPVGSCTDIDGNTYRTVTIGNQEWMAENLRVSKYPDGTSIPLVTENTAWGNLADNDYTDAYCIYNNNTGNEKDTYGALYTYAAAKDACPAGWHLPTKEDWETLVYVVGHSGFLGWESDALRTDNGWSMGSGIDTFNLSIVPAGFRLSDNGTFSSLHFGAYLWTATESGSNTIYRYYFRHTSDVSFSSSNKLPGFSVRCVKDASPESLKPISLFSSFKLKIRIGDTIQFNDYSTNNPTSWQWDFDNGSSNSQNPKHVFSQSGTYTISLITSNSNGADTAVKVDYITVLPAEDPENSLTDIDGNTYAFVTIGNQEWMAENLKTTHFTDGTPIPYVAKDQDWEDLEDTDTTLAYCYLNNNASGEKYAYATLYTYGAALNVCPTGSHLPTSAELDTMYKYLRSNGYYNEEGTALKSDNGWIANNNGTDNFGFSAYPGGLRSYFSGSSNFTGEQAYWWTSTSQSDNYATRYNTGSAALNYGNLLKSNGLSIRCIKESLPQVDFGISDAIIIQGDSIRFTDSTKFYPTKWHWSFGDGDTSNLKNPYHTYTDFGTYTVTLRAENQYGTDSLMKSSAIIVLDPSDTLGTVTDIHGTIYNTKRIGIQWWMTKNLKVTHYNDGTEIPKVESNTVWSNLSTPAFCWFYNDSAGYAPTYGGYYNWYVVETGKVCPADWHVPTNEDWQQLVDYVSPQPGTKLKEGDFNALMGGVRFYTGAFNDMGGYGHWWSSDVYDDWAGWAWGTSLSRSTFSDGYSSKNIGFNVRCIKDSVY
jgi:uncharacterized protein (TIGR02145 family)